MKYKIIFFDVDGTITNYKDGTIPESTKMAIRQLTTSGMKVVAATGRPLSMCGEIAELGVDTFITANGAYVTHRGTCIHKTVLPSETVNKFTKFAFQEQNALTYYSEKLHMNEVQHPKVMKALYETLRLEEFPPIYKAVDLNETYLLCLFADDTEIEKYKSHFPKIHYKRWHSYIVNVLVDEVSKSVAIKKVLNYFGLTKEEAIAFGDGENDVDMLELVDLGIAMGNANETLKSIANFVTKDSSEDGIALALKKYDLI
ncbi:Cof-type HAD-IIB family hydrolase [Solibacillus daqui]|uniref:Cof-type HAD-IIB family hydrolase n=1 Tax=Solibacillus daqui TaxID=2912187 RepID=UPI0023670115|nr:Cof-type HAD-IIB family hydrolase [Solibacillus daqui]